MTIDKDYIINDLNSNSTFYDWFIKENTEIIEKLNMLKVFDIQGVNGITAPVATNGVASIGLSGKVDNGISFNGPAYFNGFAAIPNIAVKVPQINSTVGGFTFGTPVRVYYDTDTSTVKYEAARGNDPDQAEVMGVISEITPSYAYVTLVGKIDGDFSEVNARGIGLTAGWIYFLDPGTTGEITDSEPIATGYVSKPVLMGLTGNSGLVLQMRGNYLNPVVTSAGGTGANTIVLVCDTDLRPVLDIGNFASIYNLTSAEVAKHFTNRKTIVFDGTNEILQTNPVQVAKIINTQYGSKNSYLVPAIPSYSLLGYKGGTTINNLVDISVDHSSHIIGFITSITTDGLYYYYTILINGYSSILPKSFEDYFNPPSPFLPPQSNVCYFEPSYTPNIETSYPNTMQLVANNKDLVSNLPIEQTLFKAGSFYGDKFLVDIKNAYYNATETPELRSTQSNSNNTINYLINGNFEVWQRDSIGKYTEYTSTGNTIFADIWRRRDGITGDSSTKSYYLVRRSFDEYQTQIESNPNYYLDIKALGLSALGISGTSGGYTASDHLFVGHVVPGAKKFDNQVIKFNFYAKSSIDGYPLNVYFSRHTGNQLLSYDNLGSVNLSTTWNLYSINTSINALENNGIDIDLDNDYCEIGFDLIPSIELANINGLTLGQNLYFSIASASLGIGSVSSTYPDYADQLRYCQQFYYSTYDKDQTIGSQTMSDVTTPVQNTESIFIQPNKSCNLFKWPIRMRTNPSIIFYSPYSGISGRAYNKTASTTSVQLDTINTSGTIGYNSQIRNGNNASITGTSTVHGVDVCLSNGFVPYDEVYFHIIADADFTI